MSDQLSSTPTKGLVEELAMREGVARQIAEPCQDLEISINGPAIVLIITD